MDWVQLIKLILFYLLSSQHYLIISSLQHFIALGKQVWIDFILIYPASSFHPSTSTSTSPYLLLLYPQFIVFLLVITFNFPLLIHFQLTHLLHFLFLNLLHFLLLHLLICFLLTLLCCLHYCLNFHSFTILFH